MRFAPKSTRHYHLRLVMLLHYLGERRTSSGSGRPCTVRPLTVRVAKNISDVRKISCWTRLQACIIAAGRHYEHRLWSLILTVMLLVFYDCNSKTLRLWYSHKYTVWGTISAILTDIDINLREKQRDIVFMGHSVLVHTTFTTQKYSLWDQFLNNVQSFWTIYFWICIIAPAQCSAVFISPPCIIQGRPAKVRPTRIFDGNIYMNR